MGAHLGLPEIRLSALSYTVGHYLPRLSDDDGGEHLDLNAPYQRASVWTDDQRRALIKSLYMGLPVGAVVLSVQPEGSHFHVRVVDGKQRIETVRAFMADGFTIPLAWLRAQDRPAGGTAYAVPGPDGDLTELLYSQCSERFRRRFEMSTPLPALELRAEMEWVGFGEGGHHQWRQRTAAEVLVVEAELYGLINGAGTPQTAEDMDRAVLVATEARQ